MQSCNIKEMSTVQIKQVYCTVSCKANDVKVTLCDVNRQDFVLGCTKKISLH